MLRCAVMACAAVLLAGCATMPTADKTAMLQRGMDPRQVTAVLGTPQQTEYSGNNLVWKYNMYSMNSGVVPYYLVFDPSGQSLESWYVDKEEYEKNREYMLRASPPEERKSVAISVKNQ